MQLTPRTLGWQIDLIAVVHGIPVKVSPMADVQRRVDFIENIFGGIVAAGYNFLYSVFTLLRWPIQGALRLSVRRALPRFRQLPPQTLIVVTFCAAYPALLATTEELDLAQAVRRFVLERSLDRSITVLIAQAICYALVVDVFVRLIAYSLFSHDRRRRGRLVTVVLFAYCATLLHFLVLAGVSAVIHFANYDWSKAFPIVAVTTLIFASVPATEVLARNCGAARRPTLLRAAILLIVVVSLIAALMLSEAWGEWVARRREPAIVRNLQCTIDQGGAFSAMVVVHNATDDPIIVKRNQEIQINRNLTDLPIRLDSLIVDGSAGPNQPVYVVGPREAAWFQFRGTRKGSDMATLRDGRCTLPSFGDNPPVTSKID